MDISDHIEIYIVHIPNESKDSESTYLDTYSYAVIRSQITRRITTQTRVWSTIPFH